MRKFETGATRDSEEGKHDYEGYLSPLVIYRFGEYMTKHRLQKDGSLRDSDNWQKGMPISAYIKSLIRHVFATWNLYRGWTPYPEGNNQEENLCAVIFNASGYLHELLKAQHATGHATGQGIATTG